MFLHLGGDATARLSDIVAILDYRAARSAASKEYLQLARSENRLQDISEGDPKAFVITRNTVFLSPISSLTLKKRATFLKDLGG